MKKFRVCMTRDTAESTWIEVEAESREEAEREAYDEAYDNRNLKWEPDDWWGKPYCGDMDTCIEEVDS